MTNSMTANSGQRGLAMRATRNLMPLLKPYSKWAILGPLCMMGEVALDLMQPHLLQHIVDDGIANADMSIVLTTGAWMIGLALFGILSGIGCGVFATWAAQGFGADLRTKLFEKVESLSFGNLDELQTGPLITRLTNDVGQVQDVVMMLLRIMVRVPLMLVGSTIMAIVTSPRLALIFLPLVPFVLTVLVWIIRRTYPLFAEVQRRLDTLNTTLQENLSGVRVVKAFARARYEKERFGKANQRLAEKNIEAGRLGATTMPIMMISLNVGVVATLWIGGVHVKAGDLEVGQVIAFVNYLGQTLFSLMMVSMLIMRLARSEASSERISEVLASEPRIQEAASPARVANVQGRIAFENVGFSYDGADGDPVLCDISFTAEPGETVAILGATGSGKSTLVQLIPRFYDVTKGRVTIDGIDVREMDQAELHRIAGIALQESVLFSGTILDNIRYGRPEATDEEVLAAARAAQADDFIRGLPDGYYTIIGQRGVNLSGGQKQRVAIARALLLQPRILILDDSTSAVDVRTEARIQEALAQEHAGQTRVIVAQRISAVLNADQILVLEDGRLVAQGAHQELLESSPVYREIYESQMEQGVMSHVATE
jgi:ATP-binding cassette subfamily B protein